MVNQVLLYAAALLPFLWGVSHLFPTRGVVEGFGDISEDNRRIIAMEWITEGVALIYLALVVTVVTVIDYASPVAVAVYLTSAVALIALAIVSLFTGFRIHFLPFRLCPFIFSTSAVLLFLGALL